MNPNKFKILLVDDNLKNLNFLSEILYNQGFEVLFAKNGKSAIKRATSGNPDLILLDVMMPGMDGFETCRRLKEIEATNEIPIIFMTALNSPDDKVKGFELGAVDYITKPIDVKEVLARVKIHLSIQHLQKELKKKLQKEKELNQLRSRLLSMASHELRTPLVGIKITTELLERYNEKLSSEKREEHYDRILTSISQMRELLDDILMMVKSEEGKVKINLEEVDLKEFCRNVFEEFKMIGGEANELIFSAEDSDFRGKTDKSLLNHIISNLLSNAIKYSPEGKKIYFDLSKKDGNFIFQVKDEGIGIPPEDRRNLFQAFHRGQNVGDIEGTGLGLSIVKQFIERLNGEITVESEVNKGTTFTVKIPEH
jgi:signal transduction histidine kinase